MLVCRRQRWLGEGVRREGRSAAFGAMRRDGALSERTTVTLLHKWHKMAWDTVPSDAANALPIGATRRRDHPLERSRHA
eukprot:3755676-Prymnesium_polylepis.1